MRRFLTLAAVLAALAAGCGDKPAAAPGGGGGTPAASSEPVRIGVAGPITGSDAKNGEDLRDGTTLAVDEWNAKGGVLGRKIEIVVRDDQADPKLAPTVAGQLVDQKVVGVVGHFNSGNTIPASETYNNNGIVVVTPASTAEDVTERGLPLVFRVCGRDDQQGPAAANYIADVMKAKRVAIFDDKTAYGKGLADNVEKGLAGRAEVVLREGFARNETAFRPYLSKLRDANVDVWYFGGIYSQAAPLLLQARQAGITAPMMSGDGVHGYTAEFLAKVGAGAEGTLTTFPHTAGAPGYKAFIERYAARFPGREPGPYAMYSYVAASVILRGIELAGTTEGTKVGAAIHSGTFETPLGSAKFDAKGDVVVPGAAYVVWVVKDGKHTLTGK